MSDYTADDREPGEFPTDAMATLDGSSAQQRFTETVGATPSGTALRQLWAERDQQYATSPKFLTEAQIEAIRTYRYREALAAEDSLLITDVDNWYPPEHGQ